MSAFEKVTSDTNETVFSALLDGYRRLTIPLFQREYRWAAKEYLRFKEDIEGIVSHEEDTRFIGAIVVVERTHGPNEAHEYELVDGQQRLVTIYLTIAAAAAALAGFGNVDEAARLLKRYLYLPDAPHLKANTKLIVSLEDGHQFAAMWRQLLQPEQLREQLGRDLPRSPAPTGPPSGRLLDQYGRVHRWLVGLKSADKVLEVVAAAIGNLSFVWLSLKEPSIAPRIFESLNNRGVRTTVGDLVRNEVFSKVREDPQLAQSLYDHEWKPFVQRLGPAYENFFFPFGLVLKSSTKKTELFGSLRELWGDQKKAGEIISDMEKYVRPYVAIAMGDASSYPPEIAKELKRLVGVNAPSSVYPFAMRLLKEFELGDIQAAAVADILRLLESFFARRAIIGQEPTGLHVVFKSLWAALKNDVTAQRVLSIIASRGTVTWPTDTEVTKAINERAIYKNATVGYLISEYDRSLGGDQPADKAQIEHILPQRITDEWRQSFSSQQHERWRHTWANLVPLSDSQNNMLQRLPYEDKRAKYRADSMYKTPRHVADTYAVWTPAQLEERTQELTTFALTRWPHQPQRGQ